MEHDEPGKRLGNNLTPRERAQMQRITSRMETELWEACCIHTRKSLHYIGEMFSLRCAPDLLALGLFPDAKELTESFAAYHAVRNHLPRFSLRDPEVTLVSVGDGSTPRTAGTFAFRSSWRCISVDPLLRVNDPWPIQRLELHPKRIEEIRIRAPRVVVVAVHSHARLDAALRSIEAEDLAVVAIPCCVPQILGAQDHDHNYVDHGILSPQRNIYIWSRIRG